VVLAENGSPARGAHIWAVKLQIHQLDRVDATADDQGRFAMSLGPGRWIFQASLGDQGLAEADVNVSDGHAVKPAILRLSPQGRLRVRLIEAESGRPIKGGRLVLDNGLDPSTNVDGRFEIGGVSRARYHESFVVAPGRERKRVLFEMSDRPVTELEIPVPRGGRAVGRVVDPEGHPIPRAFVGRSTSGSMISLTGLWVRTDEEGRFDLDGLVLDRTTWLNAVAEGFDDAQRDGVVCDSGTAAISLDFRLARNPASGQGRSMRPSSPQGKAGDHDVASRRDVFGVVLDPDGKPVAEATVRWGTIRSDDTIEARTGDDGKFRLALVPEEAQQLCVIPAKPELAPEISSIPGRGNQEIHVVLAKGRTARGIVCDDRGTPFSGVMVLALVGAGQQGRLALWERTTKTDEKGRFAVEGLPGEHLSFTFLGQGVSALRDHPLDLDQENTVVMTGSGEIRGKVLDQSGKPVRSFRVLLNASRERKPADTDGGFFAGFCGIGLSCTADDGSFVVRNLNGGSVQRVTVLAPGYGEASIDRVVAEPLSHLEPDRPVTFRLPPPHTLKIHAVDQASGQPIASARVALIYDDPSLDSHFARGYHDTAWGDSVHARTDAAGVAAFSPLSFGEATVLVQAAGYARQHVGWRNGASSLSVKLPRAAVVSGELLDRTTGKPLEGLVVRLISQTAGQFSTSTEQGGSGRFRLDELPAGDYVLVVSKGSGASLLHSEQLKLEPGSTIHRTLRLSPGR
jgi:5-hydroxyisourate hydrolase-like protein (transthyretin family)